MRLHVDRSRRARIVTPGWWRAQARAALPVVKKLMYPQQGLGRADLALQCECEQVSA
jgi:hypothetical protein